MLKLPDSWVWDFWLVDDGTDYHAFFLFASKALHDPILRHNRAGIGHAISKDLVHWQRVDDALVHSDAPAFDDTACWTGSVVKNPSGSWEMFYTGISERDGNLIQKIGRASSKDLITWHKKGMLLEADRNWYEMADEGEWPDEHFRDPWVFKHTDGDWHMLLTARQIAPHSHHAGVIGHAVSTDLENWTLREPLSNPDAGFGHLEVCNTFQLGNEWFLIFNCLDTELDKGYRPDTKGGIWVAKAASPLGPFDLANARVLADPRLYVGKIITDRQTGQPMFMAFRNTDPDGTFHGYLIDPILVSIQDGWPTLEAGAFD